MQYIDAMKATVALPQVGAIGILLRDSSPSLASATVVALRKSRRAGDLGYRLPTSFSMTGLNRPRPRERIFSLICGFQRPS